MTSFKIGAPVALLAAAALTLSGCAANETKTTSGTSGASSAGAASGTLTGEGSSAQQVAVQAWTAAYQTANTGITINYTPSGSGAGRKAFIAGGRDWAGSDAALNATEMATVSPKCAPGSKMIDIPVYISPIAVAYNVTGVSKLNLSADVTAKIFAGKITKWNDPAIAALNSTITLPDLAIKTVHRSDDSGTTQNFTDWLSKAAPASWTDAASQTWPKTLAGEAAKGTSGVVAAVKGGAGMIGYADESQTKGMTVASIGDGGTFAAPTAAEAAKVVDASPIASGRDANDLALSIDRKAAGYPVVLVSYMITCQQFADPAVGTNVKGFIGYVTSAKGQQDAVATAGNAPLPSGLSAKIASVVASIK